MGTSCWSSENGHPDQAMPRWPMMIPSRHPVVHGHIMAEFTGAAVTGGWEKRVLPAIRW